MIMFKIDMFKFGDKHTKVFHTHAKNLNCVKSLVSRDFKNDYQIIAISTFTGINDRWEVVTIKTKNKWKKPFCLSGDTGVIISTKDNNQVTIFGSRINTFGDFIIECSDGEKYPFFYFSKTIDRNN